MSNTPVTTAVSASGPGVDLADLKRKSVRGGLATLLGQGISTGVQLVSTVVLARLLSPEDFGVISMVGTVTAFAGLFRDLGLSSAAIQKRDLSCALQSSLFWINVTIGAVLTGLLAAASPLVARFYARPELTMVTVALSFNFLISSLGTQHGVLLTRRMEFGRKALAEVGGAILGLTVSIGLALRGYRYWALVWGGLSGSVASVLLLLAVSPFRPSWPRKDAGVMALLGFGANVTAFDIVNYFHRNLDRLLIGRVWGAEAVGLYSRAYALLMFPIQAIRNPLNAVAFPAMTKLQNDPEAFRAYYRRATSTVAYLSMPLCTFLLLSAKPVIYVLLGERWLGVVPIFAILAAVAFIQPAASLRGLVLLALGCGRRYLHWGVFNAVFVTAGFVLGLRWGPVGVAAGYGIATYAILQPSLYLFFRGTPVTSSDFWRAIARPAIGSVLSAPVLLLLPAASGGPTQSILYLLCGALLYAAAYVVVTCCTASGRAELRYFVGAIKAGFAVGRPCGISRG